MVAVIRVHKTKDYTVMSNTHFREKGMTLKAKGLLSLMFSLPDDWDYSIAGLTTLSKDGKDGVMSALNELEKFGYLKRTRLFDEKGHFAGYDYDIFEQSQLSAPYSDFPNTAKPNTAKPNTDNPSQYITKESNTKELNTDLTKEKKERKKGSLTYDEIIAGMVENENVKSTLYEFIKMRKFIKKPLTDFALKKLINKLFRLSSDPAEQVSILETSILNNWQDIYEPKEKKEESAQESEQGTYKNVSLTQDEYNSLADIVQERDGGGLFAALDTVEKAINLLSEYMHNNPTKKYSSHYKAITDWVLTAVRERELKEQELAIKEQELEQRRERIERHVAL